MDAKYLAEIKARDSAELPETAAPVFRDRHALLAEVERLNRELSRIRSNAADDKKMLRKYNAAKDRQNATLKKALELACKDHADGCRWHPDSVTVESLMEYYIRETQPHQAQGQEADHAE